MGKENPGTFSDLGKRSKDLLTKEFPSENKYAWKGTSATGVTIESSITQKKDGAFLGSLLEKYKHKDWNTTFSLDVNTKKELKVEEVTDDLLKVDGLKSTVTGYYKPTETYGTIGLEYTRDYASVAASVDVGKPHGTTLKGSAVVGAQGFAVGVETEYFIGGESEMKNLTTFLTYNAPDFEVAAFGRILNNNDEDKNELGVRFFHKVNSDAQIAAEVVFDTANADVKPKLEIGGQYNLKADTTIKAKLDTAGKLGLSFLVKQNNNAKITFSSTFDLNNPGGKNASTFGLTLNLND